MTVDLRSLLKFANGKEKSCKKTTTTTLEARKKLNETPQRDKRSEDVEKAGVALLPI